MTDNPEAKSKRQPPKLRPFDENGEKTFEVYKAATSNISAEREYEAWLSVDGLRSPVNPFYAESGIAAIAKASAFWDAEVEKARIERERRAEIGRQSTGKRAAE